jgi:hypothetical protein
VREEHADVFFGEEIGRAVGAVGDAVGERVPGADRFGAFEPRAIRRPGVQLRCVGAAEATPITPDADGGVTVELALDDQPLGALALTLTVVDTDGASATATVTVDIAGPLGSPTVVITTPEDGSVATVGDAVAFRGEATDQTTPADDLVFVWTSDLDGALAGAVSGDGASALFTETLSVGTHVVTLSATDTDGEVGTDTVTLVVEEEVVIAEPGDLVFSEMMVNPESVEDDFGEWVELYNTSGSAIDITGYSFRDDDVDLQVLEGPLLVAAHAPVIGVGQPRAR